MLSEFNYNLPKNLIATVPMKPRDHSRLLILDKETGKINHKYFYDIIDYLKKGDVLVMNNSKVFPARLIGKKKETGGKIEILLHHKISKNNWNCMLGGKGIKVGLEIVCAESLVGNVKKNNNDGTWELEFNFADKKFMEIVNKIGKVPLPPYIEKRRILKLSESSDGVAQDDKVDYQTVYADEKMTGSVAAPTAGLHFTKELMRKIKDKGVKIEYVTLHVGLGTFAPVKVNDIKKHKMHAEWVEVKKEVIKNIVKAKNEKKRIIAVGTTSARTLEAVFSEEIDAQKDYSSWTDIFIYPGYEFKIVDAMITNFHLPKSTLLMLVSALAGKKNIDKAYQEAIKKKYRFYSYGDAMFIE